MPIREECKSKGFSRFSPRAKDPSREMLPGLSKRLTIFAGAEPVKALARMFFARDDAKAALLVRVAL
jgi:hypothetical protein